MNLAKLTWAVGLVLAAASSRSGAADLDPQGVEFFEKKIRPVLVEHCYQCHSAEAEKARKLRGGLLLDSREGLSKGGETGPALVPGKPAEGTLLRALRHAEGLKMPPKGKLPDSVLADFERWIKIGAPDPRDGKPSTVASAIDFDRARREHWAFQAPVKRLPPRVQQSDWPRNDIDRFILARLEAEGLRPVAQAGKREWLRRASFDLLGLPPTPEEVAAFLKDESPAAFATVVDRLLASPHYGERWGRHWLDVARYAEDKALATAVESPHAYRYRDWVVQAFNRDMPYDQFLRLQLAGDLVKTPADDPFVRLAGLGFQGLGQLYHRGNFAEQVMADELDDRIDTVSRGLLGLTVACARCHDHKYDPIPTRDYYSLAAAYQGSGLTELPLASPAEVERHARFVAELKQRESAHNQWLAERGRQIALKQLHNLRAYLNAAWQIRARRVPGQSDEKALAAEKKLSPYFLARWVRLLDERDVGKSPAPLAAWHAAARAASRPGQQTPPAALAKATDELCHRAAELAAELQRIEESHQRAVAAASPGEKSRVKRTPLSGTRQPLARALLQDNAPLFLAGKDVVAHLDEAGRREHLARTTELETFRKAGPPVPLRVHGVSGGGQAMKVHIRGNVERKGELAPPGFLHILQPAPSASGPARFTRLDLAEAIVSRDNPLTARVLINRVWQHHFGRGIVATASNFGKLGEPPSHPELLDYLAVSFLENGWSLKWLHRQIMLSQTYRLASLREESSAAPRSGEPPALALDSAAAGLRGLARHRPGCLGPARSSRRWAVATGRFQHPANDLLEDQPISARPDPGHV